VGAHGAEDIDEGELIEQVGLVQLDAALQMGDALEVLGARTANDAVDLIALVEEQIGQIAAVLARDAGDDGFFHVCYRWSAVHAFSPLPSWRGGKRSAASGNGQRTTHNGQ